MIKILHNIYTMEEINNTYKCSWCGYILDENFTIIKDEEERNKYKDAYLAQTYCEECSKILIEENFYG